MLGHIQGLFSPAPQVHHNHHNRSIIVDTIVAVALGALSFVMADAVEHSSPDLAVMLRILPAAISLVWIFRRCHCSHKGWGGGGGGYHQAPVVHVVQQPFYRRWTPNWFWNSGNHYYQQPQILPAVVPHGPTYQSPYQQVNHHHNHHHKAQTTYQVNHGPADPRSHAHGAGVVHHHVNQPRMGGAFPDVQRAPAQPAQQSYHGPSMGHGLGHQRPMQAQTTYSAVSHGRNDPRSHRG